MPNFFDPNTYLKGIQGAKGVLETIKKQAKEPVPPSGILEKIRSQVTLPTLPTQTSPAQRPDFTSMFGARTALPKTKDKKASLSSVPTKKEKLMKQSLLDRGGQMSMVDKIDKEKIERQKKDREEEQKIEYYKKRVEGINELMKQPDEVSRVSSILWANPFTKTPLKSRNQQLSEIKKRYEDYIAGDKVGLIEGFSRNATKMNPIYSAVTDITDSFSLSKAFKKQEEGKTLDANDHLALEKYYASMIDDTSTAGKVGEMLPETVGFGLEFAATGGGAILKKAGFTGVKKGAKSLTKKILSLAGLAALQTAKQPTTYAEIARRNAEPNAIMELDDNDEMFIRLERNDKGFLESTARAFGSKYVENITEQAGALLGPLNKVIGKAKIVKALQKAFLGKYAAMPKFKRAVDVFNKIKEGTGWNGLLGEIFEEELGEPVQSLIDEREYKNPFTTEEGRERLAVEVAGIALFSLAASSPQIVASTLNIGEKLKEDTRGSVPADFGLGDMMGENRMTEKAQKFEGKFTDSNAKQFAQRFPDSVVEPTGQFKLDGVGNLEEQGVRFIDEQKGKEFENPSFGIFMVDNTTKQHLFKKDRPKADIERRINLLPDALEIAMKAPDHAFEKTEKMDVYSVLGKKEGKLIRVQVTEIGQKNGKKLFTVSDFDLGREVNPSVNPPSATIDDQSTVPANRGEKAKTETPELGIPASQSDPLYLNTTSNRDISQETPETLRRAFEEATREVESPVKSEDEQKRAFEALKSSVPTEIAQRIKKASKLSVYAEERMLDEYKKTGQLPKEAMSQTDQILEAQADRQIQSEVYKSEVAGYSTDDIKLFDQVRRVKESKKEFAEGDFETMRQDPTWGPKVEQALERYRTGEKDGMDDVTAFEEIMNLPSLKEIRMADKGLTLKERRAMRKEESAALSKRLDTAEQKLLDKDTKEATADDVRQAIISYAKTILPVSERGPLLGWVKNAKTMKDFGNAMSKIDDLADAYEVKLQAEKYIENRVNEMREIRKFFNLSAEDMKKLSTKDVRYMDFAEYNQYLEEIRQNAVELQENKQAKLNLMARIRDLNLKNWQNLQKAMKLPSVREMNTKQLEQFLEVLEPYRYGDVFLSLRKLETIDRTDLKGVKTIREARERLAVEAGVPIQELDNIHVGELDKLRYDTALAESNPFYKMMVDETNKGVLKGEMRFLETKQKFLELAEKAFKSQKRGIGSTVMNWLIPQQKGIVKYLEAPSAQKAEIAQGLTKEELDLAHFMMEKYQSVMDYHVAIEAEFGTRFGDQNYFTHIRRGILETVKEDGIVQAFKEIFTQYRLDAQVFTILDEDTGNILPLEKFFQYSVRRSGELKPSDNIVKSFLTYMRTFEKKATLDGLIPKLDTYAHALSPQKMTPKGLQMDRTMIQFVKTWINNKKGRVESRWVKQGSQADLTIRGIKSFVTFLHLGFSVPVGIASHVGETSANYALLGKKKMALGEYRKYTEQGKKIIEKYRNFIGENPWKELMELGKNVEERLTESAYVLFGNASVSANKTALLGLMTKEEFQAGEISDQRLAEIKSDIGRFRVVEGSKSIRGATAEGAIATQYLGWAIPPARTIIQDATALLNSITRLYGSGADQITKKQALELMRIAEVGLVVATVFLFSDGDDEDRSFLGELKFKAKRELSTLFQAITPDTWIRVPVTMQFLIDLSNNLKTLITLEEYKTSGDTWEEGELKGWNKLKRQLTPKLIKQLFPEGKLPEDEQEIMDRIDEQTKEREEVKTEVEILFAELKALPREEANVKTRELKQSDPDKFKKLKALIDKEKLAITDKENLIKRLGIENGARANYIYDEALKLDTKEEKNAFINNLKSKKIVTDEVLKQLREIKESGVNTKEAKEEAEKAATAEGIFAVAIKYAKAFRYDPGSALRTMFTKEQLDKVEGKTVIMKREPLTLEEVADYKKSMGIEPGGKMELDHIIDRQLGGRILDRDNWEVVSKEDHKKRTAVGNYLRKLLWNDEITEKEAREAIVGFKRGSLTFEEIKAKFSN